MPRVSVVMSVYNCERHVEAAIESILGQTFTDFEFIIIDDGSDDSTAERIASKTDGRLRVICQQNVGLTESLARALALAKSEYIARQDGDDISKPDRLAKQVKYLDEHQEVALVGSAVTMIDDENHRVGGYTFPIDHEGLAGLLMQGINPLPHTTHLFRAQRVRECGGYRGLFATSQDFDLLLRLTEAGRLASLQEPLCQIRVSMSSKSVTNSKGEEQFEYMLLAVASAAIRRKLGIDPLEGEKREVFLTDFHVWYASGPYPDWYRSRVLRRRARTQWAGGNRVLALWSLALATKYDPHWPVRLVVPEFRSAIADVSAWADREVNRIPALIYGVPTSPDKEQSLLREQ